LIPLAHIFVLYYDRQENLSLMEGNYSALI